MANCASFPARRCKRELPDKVVAVKAKVDKAKGVIRARVQIRVDKVRADDVAVVAGIRTSD